MAQTATPNCTTDQREPMAHPRLMWRNGTAYFRAKYPTDIRNHFTSNERWRSLKTKSRSEALKMVKAVDLAFDAEMDALRDAGQSGSPDSLRRVRELSESDMRKLAEHYFYSLLHQDEERRKQNAGERRQGYLGEDPEERRNTMQAFKASTARELGEGDVDEFTLSETDMLLADNGMKFDNSPEGEYSRFTTAFKLLEAAHRAYALIEKRDTGEWIETPQAVEPIKPKTTINELITDFLSDPSSSRSEDSAHGYKLPFDLLKELLGEETPAASVTRDDCERLRDVLMGLPANARIRYPTAKLVETVEFAKRDNVKTLSVVTVNNYLNGLATLFKWAERTWRVGRNPATGLTISDPVSDQDKRQPIPIESLITLFKAPLYTGCKDDGFGYLKAGTEKPRRGRFWIPLLSLFHGLRLTEACQLHVADLKEHGGVLCLFITEENSGELNDSDHKHIKTEAGERYVPLHPQLKAMGFEAYVAGMKAKGQTRMFPEIERSRGGTFDPFSKWFARFLLHTGIKEQGITFHSLRHNYRDALDRADTTRAENLALGGWAKVRESGLDNTQDGYGGGAARALGARRLAEVMAKVSFLDPDANEGRGLLLDLSYLE